MHYTTTTTLDKNLPNLLRENEFDLQGLISLVCELFGVTHRGVLAHTKDAKCKWARWVIWKFCIEKGDMTYADAAKIFNYDHSTVFHARKKLPEDIAQFEWLKVIVDRVAVEMAPKTSEI